MSAKNITYILLGGDGYFGRNFKEYLKDEKCNIIVIDRKLNYNLNYPVPYELFQDACSDVVYVINFAAISFVDYSIIHPEETIANNFNCCINGYNFYQNIKSNKKTYIYISTDEVRVKKDVKHLSPYVKSKLMCEDYLKNLNDNNIKIMRPVNLMSMVSSKKELLQQNNCILKIVSDCIKYKKEFYIHGKGTQKRMFMSMTKACELLKILCEKEDKTILDVADIEYRKLGYRTSNISISNLIYYLEYIYKFNVKEIDDPRGIYQDNDYFNASEVVNKNDYKIFIDCVEKNLSVN